MKPELLSGLDAAAYGARVSGVEFFPNFTMPIVYEIADKLRGFCDVFDVESQGSVLTAAVGAVLTEKRSFFAVNEIQAFHEFANAALMRLPLVAVGTDCLALRDIGWLIFIPESNQEVLDSIIQAYSVCEDDNVMLPGFICLGFPGLRETVVVPKEQSIKAFLPRLRIHNKIDLKKPLAIGLNEGCLEARAQQQKAMENAMKLMLKLDEKWKNKFKRSYGLFECYKLEDAETAVVIAGFDSLTAKVAVDRLREAGEKVGLLRMRVIRPLPAEGIRSALSHIKRLAVIDPEISLGSSGILYKDIRECYDGPCSSFIAGRMSEDDIIKIFQHLKAAEKPERFWHI